MKTTEKMTETMVAEAHELRFGNSDVPPPPARDKQSLIQRTTEEQIQEVSKKLAQIYQVAIRSEGEGDYFKSGDLAYQIQEIIGATAELLKKSQRARK